MIAKQTKDIRRKKSQIANQLNKRLERMYEVLCDVLGNDKLNKLIQGI